MFRRSIRCSYGRGRIEVKDGKILGFELGSFLGVDIGMAWEDIHDTLEARKIVVQCYTFLGITCTEIVQSKYADHAPRRDHASVRIKLAEEGQDEIRIASAHLTWPAKSTLCTYVRMQERGIARHGACMCETRSCVEASER